MKALFDLVRGALPGALLVAVAAGVLMFCVWAIDQMGYARAKAECDLQLGRLSEAARQAEGDAALASLRAQLQAQAAGAALELRFVPIEKEVVRYVEQQHAQAAAGDAGADCFGADELRLFNRAGGAPDESDGSAAALAGDGAARGAAPGSLGQPGGPDAQSGGQRPGLRQGAPAGNRPAQLDRATTERTQ
jgi:hypothetical protein